MTDIPINPVARRVQYTGNTGTGPFAFTFNIIEAADLAVYKGTTKLTVTTDYTVSTNADGTGSITLVSPVVATDVLTIIGARLLERTTDFVAGGDFFAASVNEQLDSQVIMAQQLDEKLTRALKVNPGDEFTDLELPLKADRKGTVLGFNATTGDPEAGPNISDVSSLAAITADIATLADIEDGTDATDAIQTVAGISSNVTTVAGISGSVSTVAGISSAVSTVAADGTDIGTVSTNIADVNTVAGSIASVNTVAGSDTNIGTVATNIANVNVVAGISSDVTTVSGISTDVTAVVADATDIGTVSTNIADVSTVAGSIASVNLNATNITAIQGAAAAAAAAAASKTAAAASESAAASSASSASSSASAASSSASSAAASASSASASADAVLTALDNFDDRYLGQKASDPTLDNDGNALIAGALYFNTTDSVMKVYEGSVWVAAYASLSGALLVANNLSDVASAASSRTNLGLGTAATTDSTAYATAAQGALADSAVQDASYVHTDNNYTTTEKNKLAGIEAGATADQTITAGSGLTGGGTGDVTISHADTSTQASLTALTGANVISDIDVDGYGHVTSMATRAMTAADLGAITGNQTITLSGDVSGSGTTSIVVTVADDSHNHIISNVDGLQTALDGKLSTSGGTVAGTVTATAFVGDGSGLTNLPASGAIEKLEAWTPTAVSAKQFTWDESIYQGVYITLAAVEQSTTATNLNLRMGHTDGTVIVGSNYEYSYYADRGNVVSSSTENTSVPLTTGGLVGLTGGRDNNISGDIQIITPPSNYNEFTDFYIKTNMMYSNSSQSYAERCMANLGPYAGSQSYTGTAYDTVEISWSAGTFVAGSGVITVYGIRR